MTITYQLHKVIKKTVNDVTIPIARSIAFLLNNCQRLMKLCCNFYGSSVRNDMKAICLDLPKEKEKAQTFQTNSAVFVGDRDVYVIDDVKYVRCSTVNGEI